MKISDLLENLQKNLLEYDRLQSLLDAKIHDKEYLTATTPAKEIALKYQMRRFDEVSDKVCAAFRFLNAVPDLHMKSALTLRYLGGLPWVLIDVLFSDDMSRRCNELIERLEA